MLDLCEEGFFLAFAFKDALARQDEHLIDVDGVLVARCEQDADMDIEIRTAFWAFRRGLCQDFYLLFFSIIVTAWSYSISMSYSKRPTQKLPT